MTLLSSKLRIGRKTGRISEGLSKLYR